MLKTIQMDHVCRVEGHGGITVEIKGNKVIKVTVDILEGARFLEPLVVGRHFNEIPDIICRICAICSAVHKITAIQAIERALHINASGQTWMLRDLLIQGGNIESHALHIFFLVLPDFFKANSVVDLTGEYPDEVRTGLKLKKLGNDIQELIGGRAIHPVNALIGGFGKLPDIDTIKRLKDKLEEALEDALKTISLLKTVSIPEYSVSPTIYAALKPPENNFSFFGNEIITSSQNIIPIENYRELAGEYVVTHSHAKQSKFNNQPFMVGALARILLNGDTLKQQAKGALKDSGIDISPDNILYNNIAQAIELIYSIEHAAEICDFFIAEGIKEERVPDIICGAGTGTGAIEAPRGTLYHSYSIDDNGRITGADIITPTAQNCANMEKDIYTAAIRLAGLSEEELRREITMIVRAYDPCISCSVH